MVAAESNFHSSRVVWAIYQGKMYFAFSEKGHKKWLMETLNISDEQFETVKRGYIRRQADDWETVNIVAYKGSKFEKTELSEEEITKLMWMTDLIHECGNIKVYTGVEIGEVGQVWKPLELLKSVESAEVDKEHKKVSLRTLIDYEDMLVNFMNYHKIDDNITAVVEAEKEEVTAYITGYVQHYGDIALSHITDRAAGYRM